MDVKINLTVNKGKISDRSKSVSKLIWEKIDLEKFQEVLSKELASINDSHYKDSDEKMLFMRDCLKTAAFKSVPSRAIKLQGPRFRASAKVKELLKKCKTTHIRWKENGSTGPGSHTYVLRKNAKKELRQQLRRENFNCKEHFYSELIENPDSKTFHRLIRMNQNSRSNSTTSFIVNGRSVMDAAQQRQYLKHYEDLAVPKSDINFDDYYLVQCELYLDLIHELNGREDFERTRPFTSTEIKKNV